MQRTKSELGPLQTQLMGWIQMTGRETLTTLEIVENLRLKPNRASELVDRMASAGLATQLRRGLYLFPDRIPLGGKWQPMLEKAVWYYLTDKGAQWQETGLGAFNHYGLSQQISNTATIYNDKVSQTRSFGELKVTFVKVSSGRLGAVSLLKTSDEGIVRRIGTLPRVVMDAVYDYSRFGSLPDSFAWIAERKDDTKFVSEIVRVGLKYGNISTLRRIGWLLSKLGVNKRFLTPLLKRVPETSSLIPVDPSRHKTGKSNLEWGVVENYPL